jgi:hypothetical protein
MADQTEIRRLNEWLQGRVRLHQEDDEPTISYDQPTAEELAAAGFSDELIERSIRAPWWPEMVTDVIETPDFAEPEEPPEQVLGYARDVVREYIWKRLY